MDGHERAGFAWQGCDYPTKAGWHGSGRWRTVIRPCGVAGHVTVAGLPGAAALTAFPVQPAAPGSPGMLRP
ncbi:MAG: hypothetical protein LBR95_09305 [Azoarcus sp.]|nr:hypothetical protein [Azoarcus sp.]